MPGAAHRGGNAASHAEGQQLEPHVFTFEVGVPIFIFGEVKGESGLTYRYFLQSAELKKDEFGSGSVYKGVPNLRITAENGKTVGIGQNIHRPCRRRLIAAAKAVFT